MPAFVRAPMYKRADDSVNELLHVPGNARCSQIGILLRSAILGLAIKASDAIGEGQHGEQADERHAKSNGSVAIHRDLLGAHSLPNVCSRRLTSK